MSSLLVATSDRGEGQEPMSTSDPFSVPELARWLQRVEEGQARIEQQVDKIAEDFTEQLERVGDDHEARIRTLERALWWAMGVAGAGAASGLSAMITTVLG